MSHGLDLRGDARAETIAGALGIGAPACAPDRYPAEVPRRAPTAGARAAGRAALRGRWWRLTPGGWRADWARTRERGPWRYATRSALGWALWWDAGELARAGLAAAGVSWAHPGYGAPLPVYLLALGAFMFCATWPFMLWAYYRTERWYARNPAGTGR